jgi:hypothetical protein
MTPSQAELLLRLAENRHDVGTEVINEMRKMGTAHAQSLLDEEQMLLKALEINRQDQQRFANYLPQPPRREPRAALVHGGRNEATTQEQRPSTASGQ